MLLIYKIKFADEENKSRVSYWSFPFCINSSIPSQEKSIQEFAEKTGVEHLCECSFHNSIATFHWSKGQLGFCPHTEKHKVKYMQGKKSKI